MTKDITILIFYMYFIKDNFRGSTYVFDTYLTLENLGYVDKYVAKTSQTFMSNLEKFLDILHGKIDKICRMGKEVK